MNRTENSTPNLPIAEADRADVLDALRGFALLGIFVSHIPDFSGYTFMTPGEQATLDFYRLDAPLETVQDFLIRGKFYSLFSLLFGIGFAVQLEGATRRGADFTRHFSRRLGVLLLIGLAHALIWYGDILKDYALIGFVLLLTRTWSTRWIAFAATAIFAVRIAWPFAVAGAVSSFGLGSTSGNPGGDFAALTGAFAGQDPAAVFFANLDLLRLKALQMIYDGKAISILSMFLLGAFIGRLGLYRDVSRHRKLLGRVLVIVAPVGLIGNAALTQIHASTPDLPPTDMWVVDSVLFAVAVPAMALTYASGFALIWLRAKAALSWLAPAGRMALTTYATQTLICIGMFYGIGLGLGGNIGLAAGTLFAIAIFVVQCGLSSLWLRGFQFGPVEWLWRRATYGVPVPFSRGPKPVPIHAAE